MWWNDWTSKGPSGARAGEKAPGNDRISLLGAADEEGELDRSRPVPWDWPEQPRRSLA
jgi:hypothetical protein